MKTIYVQDISHFAAFDEDGKTLRREILSVLDADPTEKIELDFSGITMFSTMFFNASIGYLALKKGVDYIREHISYKNLSALGEMTYTHSIENAIAVKNNSDLKKTLSTIDFSEEE